MLCQKICLLLPKADYAEITLKVRELLLVFQHADIPTVVVYQVKLRSSENRLREVNKMLQQLPAAGLMDC